MRNRTALIVLELNAYWAPGLRFELKGSLDVLAVASAGDAICQYDQHPQPILIWDAQTDTLAVLRWLMRLTEAGTIPPTIACGVAPFSKTEYLLRMLGVQSIPQVHYSHRDLAQHCLRWISQLS